jgi:UDP-glucose 4-epimerase
VKSVLITGSSGYIGQHLIKLLESTFDLFGLDIVARGNVKLYQTDITNNIFDIDQEFDTVIHLAALVNVGESVQDPWSYYQTNTVGTHNVLTQLKYKNFVFASTGAAAQLNSPYGISKRAAEDVVTDYCQRNNKNFTIFRFYNVIGSAGFAPTNPDGLFYNLTKAIQHGKFTIYGTDYDTPDGTCVRDYVHVMEICNAIQRAIDRPANQLENLGHGHGTSVKKIVEQFKQINGVNFEVVDAPRRPGDLPVSVLDNPSQYLSKIYTIEDLLRL